MKKNMKIVMLLAGIVLLITFAPFFLPAGTEFSGSDDAGSKMAAEIMGGEFEPWFSPVFERLTGSQLTGEMETLFFCIQTGIGVGILAYCFGYLVARKKYRG